ncbi:unnamed protein product [Closterium sp. NIES-53]
MDFNEPDAPRPPYTSNFRHVIGNMAMCIHLCTRRTNRRHPRHISPPPPGREVEFSNYNNSFTQDGKFVTKEHEQDWDLPTPLLESPPHDEDFIKSPSIHNYFYGHYIDTRPVDKYRWAGDKRIPFRNTPNRAFSAQNRTDAYNTWYLDSCCRQHMVGSKCFISNARSILQPTIVMVANNQQLEARACGIIVLKARDNEIHITLNDVLVMRDLKYKLLSYKQLVHGSVLMSTDPESRCILMHWKDYSVRNRPRYIGKAYPDNGVYILDFHIPDCCFDSGDLIDLQPQRAVWPQEFSHLNGRPWVKHHAYHREIDLHAPGHDGLYRNCHTPTAFTTDKNGDKVKGPAKEKGKGPATKAAREKRRAMAEEKGKSKFNDKGTEAAPPEEARTSEEEEEKPVPLDIVEEEERQTLHPTGNATPH